MNHPNQSYPTIMQTWGLLLLTLAFALGAALLIGIPMVFLPQAMQENGIVASVIELVGYVLMLGSAVLFGYSRRKKNNQGKIWRPFHSHKGVLILVVLLTPLIGIILDPLTNIIPMPEWFNELMFKMVRPNIVSFIALAVAPAILEELLFRGIILDGMLRNYAPAKAIIWSAFFFGIFHMNPVQAIFGFAIGVFLGWVYYKTRSLWPCFLIHATNNAISFFFTLYVPRDVVSLTDLMGYQSFLLLFIAAVVLFISGCYLLNNLTREPVIVAEQ